MTTPTNLLTLVSRQVMPQIQAVFYYKPENLVLLHTDDEMESREPAERLKQFFVKSGLLGEENIFLKNISHDNIGLIQSALDSLNLPDKNTLCNLTGGNKVMMLATMLWVQKKGIPFFYIEKGASLFYFDTQNSGIQLKKSFLPSDQLKSVSPAELVRCQSHTVQVKEDGEELLLTLEAQKLSPEKLKVFFSQKDSPLKYLNVVNRLEVDYEKGFDLEYWTGIFLLKLGISRVFRSMTLKVKNDNLHPVTEIDLVFIHDDKLWFVDCKDQKSQQWILETAAKHFKDKDPEALDRISKLVKQNQVQLLRKDAQIALESGGLKAQTLCIRKIPFNPTEREMMSRYSIHEVRKDFILDDLKLTLKGFK